MKYIEDPTTKKNATLFRKQKKNINKKHKIVPGAEHIIGNELGQDNLIIHDKWLHYIRKMIMLTL